MEDAAKTPPTTFRVPLDLLEELREIARIETRSLSGQVVFMLKRAVTEYQVATHLPAELPRTVTATLIDGMDLRGISEVASAAANRIIERRTVPPAPRPSTEPSFKQAHKAAAKVLSTD